VHTVHAGATASDVVTLTQATGHSRFPVVSGSTEDVIGMVHLRHALGVPYDRRASVRVQELMVAPVLVPETIELDPLLDQLRAGGLQAAVVIDEFGGVAGLVTLEDLVEELVGDVVDEHDEADDTVLRLGEGRYEVSGLLRPDEAAPHLGIALPEDDDYETLGGLVTARLGRIPDAGDTVDVRVDASIDEPGHDVRLTVAEMDGRRVDRILVEITQDEPVDAEAGDA
jgi:CBS domain containing-hemolysin-like protein